LVAVVVEARTVMLDTVVDLVVEHMVEIQEDHLRVDLVFNRVQHLSLITTVLILFLIAVGDLVKELWVVLMVILVMMVTVQVEAAVVLPVYTDLLILIVQIIEVVMDGLYQKDFSHHQWFHGLVLSNLESTLWV
jgi:hypothetical protein